jgi:1-acyl-sn-glycerol-3-phosphate acyltransferase
LTTASPPQKARTLGDRLGVAGRILGGLATVGGLVGAMVPILAVLLPSRVARIHVTNRFGNWIGRSTLWWAGCTIEVSGLEHVQAGRPAIYANNHTSLLDAFTTIWLTPKGTVGVAKKEVLYYPFYGQAWWLAGHVFLDRGRSERAKASLAKATRFIRDKSLSLCILPEGTRSDSGRLLPFKKGIVHVAVETGLPIVPMVTIGLHPAWRRSSLSLRKTHVKIIFLPPISTEGWSLETMDEHIATLREPFLQTLPPEQQPAG